MIFMCLMDYNAPAEVAEIRPQHRDYMHGLIERGHVLAAGSFLPEGDGGLFLYEAENLETARRMVENDPYIRGGAIRAYRLSKYEVHGVNPALLRVTG